MNVQRPKGLSDEEYIAYLEDYVVELRVQVAEMDSYIKEMY